MNFGGRVFLLEVEWLTYRRRMPVRYIHHMKSDVCVVCGLPGAEGNPLQHAHRVGFAQGILKFGLTPDYLDAPENIVSAHRKLCNASVQLSDAEVIDFLHDQGLGTPDYLLGEAING